MTLSKFKPRVVEQPPEPPIDIYTRWKADIAKIDWRPVAERGVTNTPVDIPYRAKFKVWAR